MGRSRIWWALPTVAAVLLAASGAAGAGAATQEVAVPVPSLEPEKTEALWRSLVQRPRHMRAQAGCRPLRGVFYAATDWLRLATKLAANASPCADYFVSVPPIVGDKTNLRPDQAARIRALGQNFHALAEFHWTSWNRWVTDNQSSWYAAGVEARRRMAQAGFDIQAGDTWAINEFPSTVRSNSGTARANARELVRGLYEGDGSRTARGVVFTVGIGQATTNVSVYQANLQNWLADVAFWTDMSQYVSDWSQEVYGDFRRYAVPGAPITLRRDYLNDYFQHPVVVARAGPPTIEPARTYLQSTLTPLANAAWQHESGYGWTFVPVDQMQAYVSAQVYALRAFSATTGQPQDRWGFAWQPRNGSGLSSGEFATQSGTILDRLGAAIRDSAADNPSDPGSGACGPPGQNLFCGGDMAEARFSEQWKSFRAWSQAVLAFTTVAQSLTAGRPSGPMTVSVVDIAGTPQSTTAPVSVRLASGSPQGQFSLGPNGPWSTTLLVSIPLGGTASAPFYYLDTRAAQPQITATASGLTTGAQVQTVAPGPPAKLRIDPASATLAARKARGFSVAAADAFDNPISSVRAMWSVVPSRLGAVTPSTGQATTFKAVGRGGLGRLVARASGAAGGTLSTTARLRVEPGGIRVASVRYEPRGRTLRVTATVVEAGGPAARGVRTSVVVRRNGRVSFSAQKPTDPRGRATFLVTLAPGCYRTTVTNATAPGYRWNGRTPPNRFCR
jgi:hypothetical protein